MGGGGKPASKESPCQQGDYQESRTRPVVHGIREEADRKAVIVMPGRKCLFGAAIEPLPRSRTHPQGQISADPLEWRPDGTYQTPRSGAMAAGVVGQRKGQRSIVYCVWRYASSCTLATHVLVSEREDYDGAAQEWVRSNNMSLQVE